jgi:hypothetical protein
MKKLFIIFFVAIISMNLPANAKNADDDTELSHEINKASSRAVGFENKKLVEEFKKALLNIVPQLKPNSDEDRKKPYYEDKLYSLIKRLPPYTYQYIGPYLHTVPAMSEKILNMPGIKETKGTYPTRIAPQMMDFAKKHLKFLHPRYYFLLMPEVWPERKDEKNLEGPTRRNLRYMPSNRSKLPKKKFATTDDFAKKYSPSKFMQGTGHIEEKKQIKRTPHPDEFSPLEEGDVIAFLGTLDEIRKWGDEDEKEKLHQIRYMGYRDNDKTIGTGRFDMTKTMQDIATPCLVLSDRIKRLKYTEGFENIVKKQGFNNIDEWAHTCEKTIKGYRVARMNWSIAFTLYDWRKRKGKLSAGYKANLTPDEQDAVKKSMDLFLQMYEAPESDRLAVTPYLKDIRQNFLGNKGLLLSLPFYGIK